MSHRKIPLWPSQKGRDTDERGLPLGGPLPLRRRAASSRLAGGPQPGPTGRAGHSGRLEGSVKGKVQWGREREGRESPPRAHGAAGASWVQGRQPPPFGVSSLSNQGQLWLQLYSLGRPEPGWEAPLSAGHVALGAWHRERLACVGWCPHPEPQRQPSLHSPARVLGSAGAGALRSTPAGPASAPLGL